MNKLSLLSLIAAVAVSGAAFAEEKAAAPAKTEPAKVEMKKDAATTATETKTEEDKDETKDAAPAAGGATGEKVLKKDVPAEKK